MIAENSDPNKLMCEYMNMMNEWIEFEFNLNVLQEKKNPINIGELCSSSISRNENFVLFDSNNFQPFDRNRMIV